MLDNFAFPFCLLYFSLKPKQHTLKPIYFFLRQMSQPLHWGLNGFHSPQMVKMLVLLGYFSSLRSTSCCQVRSQRFGKCSNGVLGALILLKQHQPAHRRWWKTCYGSGFWEPRLGWEACKIGFFFFLLEVQLLFLGSHPKALESGAAKGPSECSSHIKPSYLKLPAWKALSPSLHRLGKKILRTVLCNVPHSTFILKIGGFPINLTLF